MLRSCMHKLDMKKRISLLINDLYLAGLITDTSGKTKRPRPKRMHMAETQERKTVLMLFWNRIQCENKISDIPTPIYEDRKTTESVAKESGCVARNEKRKRC